ncbi:hypothetical protein FALBO_11784 [Fusarium albosuccineum]|uniref:F-box domain-containing protein n=1 Tax=Fusarium albosuccineum TaxID=1237068 RepID=A0A8H4P8M4_9HYPO|nr:hypothetical protein FALBO_11784 [Fusarium albosuccineum]
MSSSANIVFQTLELAQHIVYYLDGKNLFKALGITKAIWKSKEPAIIWKKHIKQLGYPDEFIDRYSRRYHPRDIYLHLCHTIDAINHGATPTSTIKDVSEKGSTDQDTRTSISGTQLLQRSHQGSSRDDLYLLDHEGLHLLDPNTDPSPMAPSGNDAYVEGREDQDAAVRNFEDSSPQTYEKGMFWEQGSHVIEAYTRSESVGKAETTVFEVRNVHGVKRGELVHPEKGEHASDSLGDDHFTTLGRRFLKVWDLKALTCVYEHALSDEELDEGYQMTVWQDMVFFSCDSSKPSPPWTHLDGSPASPAKAEAVERADWSWVRFSDGTMVTWSWEVYVNAPDGEELRMINFAPKQENAAFSMEIGVLFDRFIFVVVRVELDGPPRSIIPGPTELTILSKTGEKLISHTLHKQYKCLSCFIDIFGRLVINDWEGNSSEGIEIVDFCNRELPVERRTRT